MIFFAFGKYPSENFRVKRLYSSIQDRRIAGEIFDCICLDAKGLYIVKTSSGGINGYLVFVKEADDGVEALFMKYRDEGGTDWLGAGHSRVGWIWGKGKIKG